jgi:hypothetical protein
MNKFLFSFALATGLFLGLAAPSSRAATIQSLDTEQMSSAQFNSLFEPISGAPALKSTFQYLGAPVSGVMESQVFQGVGAAAGLYAYAYQLGVNNVSDSSGNPVDVQSASWKFNATPVGTNFLNLEHPAFSYAITDGQVGSLSLPQAAPGQTILTPAQLSWETGSNVGSLVASFVNPAQQVPALNAGGNSATFVIISNKPFTQQYVNIQSPDPVAPGSSLTTAYAATGGTVQPVPVPEPATVLAWAGMAGAVALVRRFRKNRVALA